MYVYNHTRSTQKRDGGSGIFFSFCKSCCFIFLCFNFKLLYIMLTTHRWIYTYSGGQWQILYSVKALQWCFLVSLFFFFPFPFYFYWVISRTAGDHCSPLLMLFSLVWSLSTWVFVLSPTNRAFSPIFCVALDVYDMKIEPYACLFETGTEVSELLPGLLVRGSRPVTNNEM